MTWILLILVALVLVWYVTTYNSFVSLNVKCEEAYSTMDIYLKKRYDLIPNLVETVKGYAKHEESVLEEVTKLRTEFMSASTPNQTSSFASQDNCSAGDNCHGAPVWITFLNNILNFFRRLFGQPELCTCGAKFNKE
mgnify:CR=1 FL=1